MKPSPTSGQTGSGTSIASSNVVEVPIWPTTAPPYTHPDEIAQWNAMRRLVDGANAIVSARSGLPSDNGGGDDGASLPPGASRSARPPRGGAGLTPGSAVVWDTSFEGLIERLAPFLRSGFTTQREQPLQNAGDLWFAWLAGPPGVDARSFEQALLRNGGAATPPGPRSEDEEVELEAIGPDGALGPQFGPPDGCDRDACAGGERRDDDRVPELQHATERATRALPQLRPEDL